MGDFPEAGTPAGTLPSVDESEVGPEDEPGN